MNIVKTLVDAAGRKPWSQKLAELEEEIATVQNRRASYVRERYELLPRAHDGDADAKKRCVFLHDAIGDADRELSDLHRLRDDAADRTNAENRAKASKAEQSRLAAVETAVAAWHEKTDAVDAAVDALAFALTEYKESAADLAGRVAHSELTGHLAQLASQIPGLTCGRLAATSGLAFKGVVPLDGDAAIASRLIDTGRIMALAGKKG